MSPSVALVPLLSNGAIYISLIYWRLGFSSAAHGDFRGAGKRRATTQTSIEFRGLQQAQGKWVLLLLFAGHRSIATCDGPMIEYDRWFRAIWCFGDTREYMQDQSYLLCHTRGGIRNKKEKKLGTLEPYCRCTTGVLRMGNCPSDIRISVQVHVVRGFGVRTKVVHSLPIFLFVSAELHL